MNPQALGGLTTGDPLMDKTMMELQMRDQMKLYNGVVERCFFTCVNEFSTKTLTAKEEICMYRCHDKFLKHTMRVGSIFAEQNAQLMDQQGLANTPLPGQRGLPSMK